MVAAAELPQKKDSFSPFDEVSGLAVIGLVNQEIPITSSEAEVVAHLEELCGIYFNEREGKLCFDHQDYIEHPETAKVKKDNRLWRLNAAGKNLSQDMYEYLTKFAAGADIEILLKALLSTYHVLKAKCDTSLQHTALLRVIGSVRGKILAQHKLQLFKENNSDVRQMLESTVVQLYRKRDVLARVQGGYFNFNKAVKRACEASGLQENPVLFANLMKKVVTALLDMGKIDAEFAANLLHSVKTREDQLLPPTDSYLEVTELPAWPPVVSSPPAVVVERHPAVKKPEKAFFPRIKHALAGAAAILMAH